MIESVRRIVMGGDREAGSLHTQVETVESVDLENGKAWFVWGWDNLPKLPRRRTGSYEARSWFPGIGGLRVTALRLGGKSDGEVDDRDRELVEALAAAELGGMVEDPNRPGMHRSDTIDIGVVVSGKLVVEDEDGAETVLGPGDVYVQYGGTHCWQYPDDPAHIVFVALGAERAADPLTGLVR